MGPRKSQVSRPPFQRKTQFDQGIQRSTSFTKYTRSIMRPGNYLSGVRLASCAGKKKKKLISRRRTQQQRSIPPQFPQNGRVQRALIPHCRNCESSALLHCDFVVFQFAFFSCDGVWNATPPPCFETLKRGKMAQKRIFWVATSYVHFHGRCVKINKSWPKIVWTGAIRCSDDDDDDDVYAT